MAIQAGPAAGEGGIGIRPTVAPSGPTWITASPPGIATGRDPGEPESTWNVRRFGAPGSVNRVCAAASECDRRQPLIDVL
jgi:hypothetical protein